MHAWLLRSLDAHVSAHDVQYGMQDIHLPPLNTNPLHPLPPPTKKNLSGFAWISWVVLLEAGGPDPPARRRPWLGPWVSGSFERCFSVAAPIECTSAGSSVGRYFFGFTGWPAASLYVIGSQLFRLSLLARPIYRAQQYANVSLTEQISDLSKSRSRKRKFRTDTLGDLPL